ncbi:MAG TPA: LapA family protein [Solirubrobacterales bacterium]|nr:LapA family protein [Solirubrobacterales bacterium]
MNGEKKSANWRLWTAILLAALVLIVALQNSQRVDVDVLMVNLTAPLIVVILAAAGIGAVIGYVAPLVRRHRRQERDQ